MRLCVLICLTILACSCGGGGKQDAPVEVSNIIDLTTAFHNPREVRLSELVDSVSFVALETTLQSNLSNAQMIRFSGDYIMSHNRFFDGNGKFLGKIGSTGRGPLETIWPVANAIHVDGYFYALGEKLLQYDLNGKATGKVRNLNSPIERTGALLNSVDFAQVGGNFMTYSYPDSLYFIDRDFQIVGGRQVVEGAPERVPFNNLAGAFTTVYDDKTVFYNFINDTIFHVSSTRLEPKWIVNFSEELRPDINFFWEMIYPLAVEAVNSGNIADSELVRRSKGRHVATAAYETDDYVFLPMKELVFFSENKPPPYITYFVKATGETVRVAGNGFVDDILGLGTFYPQWGIWKETMIKSIWPYELHDMIAERRRTGEAIDPRLEALAASVKPDDNPILILAHLRRNP